MSTTPNEELRGVEVKTVLSEELSLVLKKYTGKTDRAVAAARSNVSVSLVEKLVFRQTVITASNIAAIGELVKIAIGNCDKDVHEALLAKDQLEKVITNPE